MYNRARCTTAGIGVLLVIGASGCTTLDRLKQEEMANRNLRAMYEEREKELGDERFRADTLQKQLDGRDRELAAKNQTINNLESQLAKFDDARQSAQSALEAAMKRGLGDPIVITQRLPPELDKMVRELADKYPGKLIYDEARGAVLWKSDLLFALGSDVVVDSAKPALRDFAAIVQSPEAANFDALIVGHTDNKPIKRAETRASHPTNWHLSCHRSISVMGVLRGYGVAEGHMGALGYGEWRPVADNAGGAAAQAKNRRVEIFLVSRTRRAAKAGGQAREPVRVGGASARANP